MKCATCGKEITSRRRRKYCSESCYQKAMREKTHVQKVWLKKKCRCCGEEFWQYTKPGIPRSFCSDLCKWLYYKEPKKKGRKVLEDNPNFKAESLDYEMCDTGAAMLASAIICTTANEYKQAIKHNQCTLSYQNFFRSQWFDALTAITQEYCDGGRVIELIEHGYNFEKSKEQIGRRGSGKC